MPIPDCRCAIAVRVNSSLAVKAIDALRKIAPRKAGRLLKEANAHARVLRAACDRGDCGPQAKIER